MSTFENIISMFIVFVSCAILYEFFVYVKHVMKLMMYDALYNILTFEYPEYGLVGLNGYKCTIEYPEYIVFINPNGKNM